MKLNGSGARKLESWIDRFIEHTSGIETPTIFRRWAGILTLAGTLEQKTWITTSSPMYPNLYVGMIAQPGVGKTRIISEAGKLLQQLPEPYIAPTSINSSSLVDHLVECKRVIIQPSGAIEYNSMILLADELGTFMHEYENSLVAELTSFYNVTALPYGQRRRGNNLKIKIERPQLNILFGSTPSNLLKFMPEGAWTQGFASRIIFIYSEERRVIDDFGVDVAELPVDLIHDLKIINTLIGKFSVTEDYRNAINMWRENGEETPSAPKPTHPRLLHYCTRRKEHLYRLSMIASIDKSNALILTKEDFNRAMGWMAEAEATMPLIFRTQSETSDGAVMDEIQHFVQKRGTLREQELIRELGKRVNAHAVGRVMEVMERSGMIVMESKDRHGIRTFKAGG